MRVFMRYSVNIDKPVELHELKPLQRIITGIRYQIREVDIYKKHMEKKREQEFVAKMQREEKLKDVINAYIYNDLVKNKNPEIRKRKKVAAVLGLCIDRSFEDILDDVKNSKDFISFNIERVPENKDALLANPSLPIRLRISKKSL